MCILNVQNAFSHPLIHSQSFISRSPEIILGLPVSEAIDVWSLGIVTAYTISKSLLFEGKDEYETVRKTHCFPEEGYNYVANTMSFFKKRIQKVNYTEIKLLLSLHCEPLTTMENSDALDSGSDFTQPN